MLVVRHGLPPTIRWHSHKGPRKPHCKRRSIARADQRRLDPAATLQMPPGAQPALRPVLPTHRHKAEQYETLPVPTTAGAVWHQGRPRAGGSHQGPGHARRFPPATPCTWCDRFAETRPPIRRANGVDSGFRGQGSQVQHCFTPPPRVVAYLDAPVSRHGHAKPVGGIPQVYRSCHGAIRANRGGAGPVVAVEAPAVLITMTRLTTLAGRTTDSTAIHVAFAAVPGAVVPRGRDAHFADAPFATAACLL